MYRLLSDITANPHMQQTRLKGGTEGEAPPMRKGGSGSEISIIILGCHLV